MTKETAKELIKICKSLVIEPKIFEDCEFCDGEWEADTFQHAPNCKMLLAQIAIEKAEIELRG